MTLWAYRSRTWGRKAWEAWYRSAIRYRLEPLKKVARMIKRHLDGILTAVADNGSYFHLGGLDLYPAGVSR